MSIIHCTPFFSMNMRQNAKHTRCESMATNGSVCNVTNESRDASCKYVCTDSRIVCQLMKHSRYYVVTRSFIGEILVITSRFILLRELQFTFPCLR